MDTPAAHARGSALVVVLIVLAATASVLFTLVGDTHVDYIASDNFAARLEALYIADGGIHRALASLATEGGDWRGDQAGSGFVYAHGDNLLARGEYLVNIEAYDGSIGIYPAGALMVKAVGRAHRGVSRTNQAVVAPFAGYPRPITGFSSFNCGDLRHQGNDDRITGGAVYTGNDAELSSVVLGADVDAFDDVKVSGSGRIERNAHAGDDIELLGTLGTQVGGDAEAGDTVSDHSKVGGVVREGATVVPQYCSNLSADFARLVGELKPLSASDVTAAIAEASAKSTLTTVAGDWNIAANRLLQGTYHIDGGKLTTTPGISLTYTGHVVVIAAPGPITLTGANVALAAGADGNASSLTLVTTLGAIQFGAGTNATFKGFLHSGVVNDAVTPATVPVTADTRVDAGAVVTVTGGNITLGSVTTANGTLRVTAGTTVPPILLDPATRGFRIHAWRETTALLSLP